MYTYTTGNSFVSSYSTFGSESAHLSKTSSTNSLLSEQITSSARCAALSPMVPMPLYSSETVLPGGICDSTVGMMLPSNSFKLAYPQRRGEERK